EELRPDTVQVRALIENVCSRLKQFRSDVFALKIDSESLLKDVEKAQKELGSEQKLRQNLHSVALKVANEFADLVRQYGEHINNSMNNEVTSCAPLAEIASHTREAICDYALDPILRTTADGMTLNVRELLILLHGVEEDCIIVLMIC
uniref:Uncharacterized protein n=1 Tax=Meloidogyne javanica TaxID=6303 RepID=A0A915MMX7_MELJA